MKILVSQEDLDINASDSVTSKTALSLAVLSGLLVESRSRFLLLSCFLIVD